MKFERFPHRGAWYTSALPDGEYGVLFGYLHVETHLPAPLDRVPLRQVGVAQPDGSIAQVGDNPLFLDVHQWNGVFYMAGQSHQGAGVILWSTVKRVWEVLGFDAKGVNPIAFWHEWLYVSIGGNLYIKINLYDHNVVGPFVAAIGAMGIRYILADGTPITGDDTLNVLRRVGVDLGLSALSEFTVQDKLVVGQGPTGCHLAELATSDSGELRDTGRRHLVEDGDTRFIHFKMNGDAAAISIVKEKESQSVSIFADTAGLLSRKAPPKATDPILPVNRKHLMLWFEHAGGQQTAPGHGYVDIFDQKGMIRRNDGTPIGQYVDAELEGNTFAAFEQKIAVARTKHPELRVSIYWPRSCFGKPVPSADWVFVEAYQHKDESDVFFEDLIVNEVRRIGPRGQAVPQCYTSNADNTTELTHLVPLYSRILQRCPMLDVTAIFSDRGRNNTGLAGHDEVRPLWQQLFSTIQGPIDLPQLEDDIVQPKITITHWDKNIERGKQFVVETNLDVAGHYKAVFEKDASDRIHFAIYKDGILQDRSGDSRKVGVKG